MVRKKFNECYNQVKNDIGFKNHGFIRKTFDTLDIYLEGNKIYDFYYYHIWVNIYRIFYKFPQDFINFSKKSYQRAKKGISSQDVWGFNEYLLDVFYYGIKEFIKQEWGPVPELKTEEEWKNGCETHNYEMYKLLSRYISIYEVRKRKIDDSFNILYSKKRTLKSDFSDVREADEEVCKLSNELFDLYKKIITLYMENLWT